MRLLLVDFSFSNVKRRPNVKKSKLVIFLLGSLISLSSKWFVGLKWQKNMFGAGAHYTHIYILYTETEKDRHIDR